MHLTTRIISFAPNSENIFPSGVRYSTTSPGTLAPHSKKTFLISSLLAPLLAKESTQAVGCLPGPGHPVSPQITRLHKRNRLSPSKHLISRGRCRFGRSCCPLCWHCFASHRIFHHQKQFSRSSLKTLRTFLVCISKVMAAK